MLARAGAHARTRPTLAHAAATARRAREGARAQKGARLRGRIGAAAARKRGRVVLRARDARRELGAKLLNVEGNDGHGQPPRCVAVRVAIRARGGFRGLFGGSRVRERAQRCARDSGQLFKAAVRKEVGGARARAAM